MNIYYIKTNNELYAVEAEGRIEACVELARTLDMSELGVVMVVADAPPLSSNDPADAEVIYSPVALYKAGRITERMVAAFKENIGSILKL